MPPTDRSTEPSQKTLARARGASAKATHPEVASTPPEGAVSPAASTAASVVIAEGPADPAGGASGGSLPEGGALDAVSARLPDDSAVVGEKLSETVERVLAQPDPREEAPRSGSRVEREEDAEPVRRERPADERRALPRPPIATDWPRRGHTLRCEAFEGPTAVLAEVVQTVFSAEVTRPHIVVWLPGLRRHWPIFLERVTPPGAGMPYGRWTHVPGDYPDVGDSEDFDARFRTAEQIADATPAPLPVKFKPPRPARQGHIWARCKRPVAATGYTVNGERKARGWGEPGMEGGGWGEFLRATVDSVEGVFERLE